MAYCRQCGAALPEETKFCPECGAPNTKETVHAEAAAPQTEPPIQNAGKAKKSILKRWWFWVLAVLVVGSVLSRPGGQKTPAPSQEQPKAAAAASPTPDVKPSEEPAPIPTAEAAQEPETETETVSESEIRPEVKEFLDAYETCMNEYVDFMQKYLKADAASMVSMMGDYYDILSRYTEFTDKMDAFDETELTDAELAYYIAVTGRVSQKMLTIAAG